jgi:hypothetical protein
MFFKCDHARLNLPRQGSTCPRNVDYSINDGMCNVDSLGAKLLCKRLGEGPQRPLARREARHLRTTLDGSSSAREDQTRGMLRSELLSPEQQRQEGLREQDTARRTDGETLLEDVLWRLEERLTQEAARGIEDGGCGAHVVAELLLDLVEGGLQTRRVGHVGADANCFAAVGVDVFGQRFVVLGLAGQQHNGLQRRRFLSRRPRRW